MADGVALIDLDGHIAFANRAFAAIHRYEAGELTGLHLAALLPPEELLTLAAANAEALRVGVYAGEFVHCRKDGVSFPVLSTMSLVRDPRGAPAGSVLIVRDATDTKFSELVAGQARLALSQHLGDLEKKLEHTLKRLDTSQSELIERQKRLDRADEALRLLISASENENLERERTISRNLNTTVLPIVDQLKAERLPASARLLLDSLEFTLKNLCSPSTAAIPQARSLLTPQETRLCELIRAGLTSKQIADVMRISPATVVVHRANIRKKLGLVGSNNNLAACLRSMFQSTQR